MFTNHLWTPFRTKLLRLLPLTAALLLAGCGGDDDDTMSNAPGPAVYTAFSGVTIDINPTLSFLNNGQLTYLNNAASSAFPAAASALNGTYTYTPAADYLSGNLVVTLPGLGQVLNMTFQSFTTQGGKVTGFNTVYNGQSYSSKVTSGTLTPAAVQGGTASTGGSGNTGGSTGGTTPTTPSTGGSTITTPVGANEALAPDIPATMQGTHNLTFTYVQTGSPITEGTQKTFVIGAKTLAFDSKTLSGPVHRNQNPYEWIFKDGDLEYAASIRTDNTLNEINVNKTGGTPWYGQYRNLGGSGSSGSNSGSGSNNNSGGSNSGTVSATNTIGASTLYYHPNTAVSVSQPYSANQAVAFTFTEYADATLNSLSFAGKTLTKPTTKAPTPPYTTSVFTDAAAGLTYEVIINNNTSFAEIIVSNSSTWIGQFSGVNSSGSNTGGSTSGTGSGGTTGGNGTASFGSNGNFVAGTTFTHKVLSYTITPAGAAAISGFPSFTVDESVTFTVGSDGALTFKNTTLPFFAREGNFNIYQKTTSAGGATDTFTATVALQPNVEPARITLNFGRATIALPPSITTFTYALD